MFDDNPTYVMKQLLETSLERRAKVLRCYYTVVHPITGDVFVPSGARELYHRLESDIRKHWAMIDEACELAS
jgi:DNA-directed RNA polymerase subunit L